jgi:integrase
MLKPKTKKKIRSDKFPLTLHPTGQFCKKIRGKLYYFGNDKKQALQKYYRLASDLHFDTLHSSQVHPKDGITLKGLCNLYLENQLSRMQAKDLTTRYYADEVKALRRFARYMGPGCLVSEIRTVELQNYRNKLLKTYRSPSGINLNLAVMKAMFHWAKKNDILQEIPNTDCVSKVKLVRKERAVFTAGQIRVLIDTADTQMKSMIWLGLNCGFGCTDCAELRWKDLDLENARVKLARKKTGISMSLLLWPETVATLKEVSKSGDLVFYTSKGNRWVRTIESIGNDGNVKYSNDNAISKSFSKLMKKAGIKMEKGVGFYTLRRTAATLAARSGDPFAVQKLLGHADLKMATTYVQDVSEQTDRVVNNMRKLIIRDDSSPSAGASNVAVEQADR